MKVEIRGGGDDSFWRADMLRARVGETRNLPCSGDDEPWSRSAGAVPPRCSPDPPPHRGDTGCKFLADNLRGDGCPACRIDTDSENVTDKGEIESPKVCPPLDVGERQPPLNGSISPIPWDGWCKVGGGDSCDCGECPFCCPFSCARRAFSCARRFWRNASFSRSVIGAGCPW